MVIYRLVLITTQWNELHQNVLLGFIFFICGMVVLG